MALAAARLNLEIRDKIRYLMEGSYSGRVVKLEATYCFAARDGGGDWVFVHRSGVGTKLWRMLEVGSRVRFRIGFTMKGPAGCDLALEKVSE